VSVTFYPAAAGTAGEPDLLGRWRFDAMNTDVQLITLGWPGVDSLRRAEGVFHDVEVRFSRFLVSSELSRLNASGGREVAVSPELFQLLLLGLHYHRLSGGLFDLAILPSLEAAGYDRTFQLVPGQQDVAPTVPETTYSITDVELDARRSVVRAPAGLRLDLGGLAKGYAVDLSARELAPYGNVLVDAGGDIYASGTGPDGASWLVGVADPFRAGIDLTTLHIRDQALATSSVVRRRWQRGGRWLHHLIDPRTGEPAASDAVSVSVVASSTVAADVFAKVGLLLGCADGGRFLEEQQVSGLFVRSDGTWTTTAHWPGG
jgi:thiamine biosynthesis lipoprotein